MGLGLNTIDVCRKIYPEYVRMWKAGQKEFRTAICAGERWGGWGGTGRVQWRPLVHEARDLLALILLPVPCPFRLRVF